MPHNTPEKRKEWMNRNGGLQAKKNAARAARWYSKPENKERTLEWEVNAYYKKYKPQRIELRRQLFDILGGRKCSQCGYNDERALQLDHINAGGWRDIQTSSRVNVLHYYKKYVADPELARKTLQVLCANCNWIKRHDKMEYTRRRILKERNIIPFTPRKPKK